MFSKPVTLIGMMGSGKSLIGERLAHALDLNFYDSDRLIEDKAGYTVAEVFERFGEKQFREMEADTLLSLLNKPSPCIIATGGGAVTGPEILDALTTKSLCIYLRARPETLWMRLKDDQTRPLLHTQNPQDTLRALLEARAALYEQAHITIDTDDHTPETLIPVLIAALPDAINGDNV